MRLALDWRYERALQGLRLLVRHGVGQVVQALLAWRASANEEIRKACGAPAAGSAGSGGAALSLQGVCKRVRRSGYCCFGLRFAWG